MQAAKDAFKKIHLIRKGPGDMQEYLSGSSYITEYYFQADSSSGSCTHKTLYTKNAASCVICTFELVNHVLWL